METSQKCQGMSICSELNLNLQDLNIQYLLANPTYRRLYNIVAHDTIKTEYGYRKNLIRQLYFLLKITLIMEAQLQQTYLDKLQKWYNVNDHKKTQLGSGRLRNLVNEYVTTKQPQSNNGRQQLRPQSGVNWNKNISPFLRPYTAQRMPNSQGRPESHKSKFGQSTKASTKLESQEVTIREVALSITEQFEFSQDFLKNNRTIHPQSEPIYEQLFSIIKKAGIGLKPNVNEQHQDSQNQILFKRDKQQIFNQAQNGPKETLKYEQKQNLQNNPDLINDQLDQFDKVSEQSQKEQQQENQKFEYGILEKKIYTQDQNIAADNTRMQGFFHLQNQNQIDALVPKKANKKYSHLTNTKFIEYSKDDHEMVRHYVNYTRAKSAMKRQFNRKSQSKRLLSGKLRSSTNLALNSQSSGKQKNPRIYSALPRKTAVELQKNQDKSNYKAAKVYDFSEIPNRKQDSSFFVSSSKYNQHHQLDKIYRKPIQQYKKFNKTAISSTELKSKENNWLPKYDCFLSRQKINPIADIHIKNHNQEALNEIQKIKEKVAGLGKKCLSTDSLMKALYIDSYDTIGSCKQVNKTSLQTPSFMACQQQKVNNQFDWKKRNIYYNMLSSGQKKMKKKTRKLVKK